MEHKSAPWRELAPVFAVHLALTGLMIGIFYLVGHGGSGVLLGALVGLVASVGNFVGMTLTLLWAARKQDQARAKLWVQMIYLLRMLLLLALLVLALKTQLVQPLAALLPLVYFRLAIMIAELFTKKGAAG